MKIKEEINIFEEEEIVKPNKGKGIGLCCCCCSEVVVQVN